jgi:mannose-6-phosphate isomerase-like protein (cupin superfamily)
VVSASVPRPMRKTPGCGGLTITGVAFIRRDAVRPFDFDGLRILDYTAGRTTNSSLAIIEVPPGARHRQAWSRRSDKYYYVLAGQIRFTVHGEPQNLGSGDACLIAREQRFSYENTGSEAVRLLLVHTPSFDPAAEVFD